MKSVRCVALIMIAMAAGCTSRGEVLSSADGADGVDGGSDVAPRCDGAFVCPEPGPDEFTLCGRVYDLETTMSIAADSIDRAVTVSVLDGGSILGAPLAVVTSDECGRFVAGGRALPGGNLIVGIDDAGPADELRFTFSLIQVEEGRAHDLNGFALRRSTDRLWSESAGLSAQTFGSVGPLLAIFIDAAAPATPPFRGKPIAGVTITRGGAPASDDDFYFADGDPLSRSQVSLERRTTDDTGAGLLVGSPFGAHTGQKPGCTFPGIRRAAVPGAVQVQEVHGSCE